MPTSGSSRARLLHIRDEIEGVAAAINGLSFEQYRASYVHRRTVERAAQIVSEAAKALPRELLARYADVPWTSSLELETFCGMNIRDWMTPNFGRLQRFTCQRWSRW